MFYPSMRKNYNVSDVLERYARKEKQVLDLANMTSDEKERLRYDPSQGQANSHHNESTGLNHDQIKRETQQRQAQEAEQEKQTEQGLITKTQTFNDKLLADYEEERQLKLEKEKQEVLAKQGQKQIKKEEQIEWDRKMEEAWKNNASKGELRTIENPEEYAQKELEKLHGSHTVPFTQGAYSSSFGETSA